MSGAERDDNVHRERGAEDDERGDPEDEFISFGRDDVFFGHQFDGVGNGLQQAMRAHAHRAEANLEMRQSFALKPVHGHYSDGDAAENHHDINQRPKDVSGLAGGGVASEIGSDVIEHQRSTSPSTISSVPMTAITSATSCPRTMRSSACKFTKDGGRTRMR